MLQDIYFVEIGWMLTEEMREVFDRGMADEDGGLSIIPCVSFIQAG